MPNIIYYSEYTWHMARVHKRVLKLVNFEVQKVHRTCLIWRHIVAEHMMPDGQFAILVNSLKLFCSSRPM